MAPLWTTLSVLSGALIFGLLVKHTYGRRWDSIFPLSAFLVLWATGILSIAAMVNFGVKSYWIGKPIILLVSFLDVAMVYASWNVEKVAKRERGTERPPSATHALMLGVALLSTVIGAVTLFQLH